LGAAERAALAALLLLAAAGASLGHGTPPPVLYDPLLQAPEYWLADGPNLASAPPADGSAALPAGPGGDAQPAAWATSLPLAGTVLGGIRAHLVLQATGPVVPRVPDGAFLEVSTLHAGEAVEGDTIAVAAPETPMQPGKAYTLDVSTGDKAFKVVPGDAVALAVTFVGVAPAGGVQLGLGADGSRANLTLHVAGLDALGHDHAGWRHVTVDEFLGGLADTTEPVMDIDARHGNVTAVHQTATAPLRITLRIDNEETPEQGHEHDPWGLVNSHVLRLTAPGVDETFHLYPSEVLLRTLTFSTTGQAVVSCVERCNPVGPFAVLDVLGTGGGGNDGSPAPPGSGLTTSLAPGGQYEANFPLAANQAVRWSFITEPPTPMRYDLHHHEGAQVLTHAEGEAVQANGTFTAPGAALYSLFLQNVGGQTAKVTYVLEGAKVASEGTLATKGAPFPAGFALAAFVLAAVAMRRRLP